MTQKEKHPQILIVEDEQIIAENLKECLVHLGYPTPALAFSREEALQCITGMHPDLVLMDINLGEGDIDGITVATELREVDIPVVYLTAYDDDETFSRARITGPFGYLLKPFQTRELHTTIEIALYKHQMEQQLKQYRDHLEHLVDIRTAELERTLRETQQLNIQLQQEIVERKRIEQALRAGEQQYRLLAENTAEGVAIFRAGKVVFANTALCSMLGYTPEHLLQTNPFDLLHPDYREAAQQQAALAEQAVATPWQALCVTEKGREIWVETRRTPIEWEGNPAILVTVRDITEQKLQENAVNEEREKLQREIMTLRSTIQERYKFGDIIGKSPVMQAIYELIVKAAASDVNVLIYGESGTGKDLIARTIHQLSKRHDKAFVPVNCGAVPDTLFEREFFGHRKGAFTGAYADTSGFFDRAHEGVLFLDEVSEIPQHIQVKLLRALESGEYTPVGSNSARIADVRIIAATNKSFDELIREQALREDFFYRVHVVSITVPPVRERKDDLPLLIEHFMRLYGYDKRHATLPGEILGRLYAYDWPGNIRELQNVLHRYFTIGLLEFRSLHKPDSGQPPHPSAAAVTDNPNAPNLREALQEFEKRFILQHLEHNRWHKSRTAEILGIPRRTLHRKLKQFGITQGCKEG